MTPAERLAAVQALSRQLGELVRQADAAVWAYRTACFCADDHDGTRDADRCGVLVDVMSAVQVKLYVWCGAHQVDLAAATITDADREVAADPRA